MIIGPRGGGFNRRNWLADVWRPAFKLTGIKKYRVPYGTRHSAASNLTLAAGWDAGSVSDQLGHSSASFTMTRYQHQFDDAAKRRNVPIEQQIRQVRIEDFGYDFGNELAARRASASP